MHLILFFLSILVLSAGVIFAVYRFQGKKQVLKFDIVQFFYAFVFAPLLFIWIKTFLFVLIRNQLGTQVTPGELFAVDTVFSTLFLFFYAFIVLHALTKTFWLRNSYDPLYDLFSHSEYIHLWLAHIVMFVGGMVLISFISLLNLFFPLNLENSQVGQILVLFLGIVTGWLAFTGVLLADPIQENGHFLRLMKLAFGFFFSVYVIAYFFFEPTFSLDFAFYWWGVSLFSTAVFFSFFTYRSRRAKSIMNRSTNLFKHFKWGVNISIFEPKKG